MINRRRTKTSGGGGGVGVDATFLLKVFSKFWKNDYSQGVKPLVAVPTFSEKFFYAICVSIGFDVSMATIK